MTPGQEQYILLNLYLITLAEKFKEGDNGYEEIQKQAEIARKKIQAALFQDCF